MSKEEAFRRFREAKDHFSQPYIRDHIAQSTQQTYTWLMSNKNSTDRHGNSIANSPWLPLKGIDRTDDPDRLDLRRAVMRKKLFSHGLRRLLGILIQNDAMLPDEDMYDEIANVTGFRTMALHEELIGYRLSPIACAKSIALKELTERFDMSDDHGATKLRDSLVVPMSKFGLLDVETDDRDRYYIRSGVVAEAFHKHIFSPVRAKYEPLLIGEGVVQQAEK